MGRLYINDVEKFILQKLKKPDITHPAIYVNPGIVDLSTIPYKIYNKDQDFLLLKNDVSNISIKVEVNNKIHDFYIINKQFVSTNTCKFSKDSNLSFGYGLTALPNLPLLPFIEKFKIPKDIEVMSWWNECVNSAKHIKERYKDIFLCLSGGLDSELMALAFIDANVKFTAFSLVYKHKDKILNEHDIKHAVDLCKKYNIKLVTKDVNILEDLYNNRHREYFINGVYETYFILPYLYTQQLMIEYINKLGGVPIMASDQVEMKLNKDGEVCIGDCSYSIGLSAPTWAHLTNNTCIYDFFMYSPEQIYAFLKLEDVQSTKTVDYNFKRKVSMMHGSQKLKFYEKITGYEYIKESLLIYYKKEMHEITFNTIEDIDWTKKPMAQFIHPIKDIISENEFNNWQIIRTTSNDFLARGFKENDPLYYDI